MRAELGLGGRPGQQSVALRLPGGDVGLQSDDVVRVLIDGEGAVSVPIERAEQVGDTLVLEGHAGDLSARAAWRPAADGPFHEVEITVRHRRSDSLRSALRFALRLTGGGTPRWLIPGCFYGENRIVANRHRFPRWDPTGGDPRELVSDAWSFRSDRAALAMVAATTPACFTAMATDEASPLGLSGIGFSGDGATSSLWVDAPYREEPVTFAAAQTAGPAERLWHAWSPGEPMTIRATVAIAPSGAHAYAPMLRTLAARRRATHGLHPWVSAAEAAALAAEGLFRWHYRPERRVLYETAAFDRRGAGAADGSGDRASMHVAWLSGAPAASALLRHGRAIGDARYVEAATAVLDTVAGGIAPCGAFWGEWRDGRWTGGWNGDPDWLHARTLAEATLFMGRALRADAAQGVPHAAWARAVRSNLAFVVARQAPDGNLGGYYHARSGEVTEWMGAAGLLWIAAMVEDASASGDRERVEAARRAGAYYARFVEQAFIFGGPEDVHLTPTSEDAYNAVIAYLVLHEATGEADWLGLARQAAEWMLTFRFAYNVAFDPMTTLGARDFRTRGADLASPSNQHLHAYGLICLPEMLRLWRLTGDDELLVRTQDNFACFLQFVARRDGDFGARRGMAAERYHQTDWEEPKGTLGALSHAWSVGLLLAAADHAASEPDAIPS